MPQIENILVFYLWQCQIGWIYEVITFFIKKFKVQLHWEFIKFCKTTFLAIIQHTIELLCTLNNFIHPHYIHYMNSGRNWLISVILVFLLSSSPFITFMVAFPQLVSQPPLFWFLLFNPTFSSSATPSRSLTLCAPSPSTHQSLALASPLRTYGMIDRRARSASKSKGHLPGALNSGEALGPAM